MVSILSNEKYRGDALLQKQYTIDFLQKTRKINNGEVPQYYVNDHHEAIISPEQFDYVQAEIARRKKAGRRSGKNIFSHKIKCGCCGGWYGPKVHHSTDRYRRCIYRCNRKYEKGTLCDTPNLTEEQIKEMFLQVLNSLADVKEETTANLKELRHLVCRTKTEEEEQALIDKELEKIIREKKDKRIMVNKLIHTLSDLTGEESEFREELWCGMVDFIEVKADGHHVITFRGGLETII